ncbi:hypothetical protein J3R30DRAFT_3703961 [Lentinula aciculospora]|uniref:Uncharacterized protein n=1 Tax=Lentinula aciculospora TaxID=153920 RepID=A0A9W9AAI0_9AGAR|nr:hypothetical protein J3R30DRAFT_3703961 [Lentinula aciculospora]
MDSSHKSNSSSSVRSSSNVPRRPKSPVSMYQMGYGVGAPKPPRPLVRLEPKVPKSNRTSTFDNSSNHSPSISISSSFASSSSSVGTSSTNSTKGRPPSRSFLRLFSKRKASTTPPTIFEPLNTPVSSTRPFRSPESEARLKADNLDNSVRNANRPPSIGPDDNEILEVLRESHPGHYTAQTHSRRASLTLSPIRRPNSLLQEQPPVTPYGTEHSHLPPRPNRNPKRPKTAPSSHSDKRPLPQIPKNEAPSIATSSSPVAFGDLDNTTPRPIQTEEHNTRKIESPSLSLTRSKSISHSMMMVAPRPDSPFIDVSRPMQSYLATSLGTNQSRTSSSNVERSMRPQGWSGEWNINDMQDVIQKLRELK